MEWGTLQDEQDLSKKDVLLFPHPQLRGGGRPFAHKFSPSQILTLAAICDTIVPSTTVDESHKQTPVANKMFELSASLAGIVPEVAGMMCTWPTREQFLLIDVALFLLSTRLGSFILCGFNSITSQFPFLQPFAALNLARRRDILVGWSRSSFHILQMLFKVCKCYTLYNFYSRADENGSNPCWEAIGYHLPSPIVHQEIPCRLSSRVIEAGKDCEHLRDRLTEAGCQILDDVTHLSKLRPKKFNKDHSIGIKCDVVIAGSGCGGAVIAAELAKKGFSVVVLEKGRHYNRKDLSLLEGPSMLAMYEQSGALTTEDAAVILLAGSTLGGGSAINWAAALATPDHVLKEWCEMGLERFSSEKYKPIMEAVCKRLGVQESCAAESFQNEVLRRGCTAMGYNVARIPRNAGPNHFCGFCGFGCPHSEEQGRKQSAAETWLVDAAVSGAVFVTNCTAEAVLSQGRKARGIVARIGSEERFSLYVEARVCVSACGSLFTPPLLHRSGLRNRHIGQHLSLHPVLMVWGHFPEDEMHLPGNAYSGGIMTTFSAVAANWNTSGYGSLLETPALHPGTYAAMAPWSDGYEFKLRMLRYSRTANVIVLNRDKGNGIVDEDYSSSGKPVIRYALGDAEKKSLIQGTVCALRALRAAGADSIGTNCIEGEIFYCSKTRSDRDDHEEFEKFVKRVSTKMFKGLRTPIVSAHQMGSCRMGVDPKTSAVDANCETWEIDGLFVGDASVFPNSSGVNPMVTIQSIALGTSNSIASYLG